MELRKSTFNIRKDLTNENDGVIDNAAMICYGIAAQKGITINTIIGDGVPSKVIGDGDKIRQILVNLICNAVKFSPTGKTVTVSCYHVSRTDDSILLRFEVADEGKGIAPEDQEKLFKEFIQLVPNDDLRRGSFSEGFDSRRSDLSGGSGLGLTISKRLVLLMDGKIKIQKSVMGEGTVFEFTANLGLPPESPDLYPKSSPRLGREDKYKEEILRYIKQEGRRCNVLLVEDNKISQKLMSRILEGVGIKPTLSECGIDALTEFQKKAEVGEYYDIVFMDIHLPGYMDGLETTKLILKEWEDNIISCKYKPVIFATTGSCSEEDIKLYLRNGMSDCLIKPLNVESILKAISRVLTGFY